MTRLSTKRAALLLAGLSLGCGGTKEPPVPITPLDAQAATWGRCPDDLGGPRVDCTLIEVPLHSAREEPALTTVLLRRRSTSASRRGGLWALDGGPGFAGDSFFDPAFADLVDAAGLDLYVPSHRGSIGPTALSCPPAQSPDSPGGGQVVAKEWPACRSDLEEEWGDDLTAFSVRAAALDVARQMRIAHETGISLVFGGSYGTLWAHRLLLDTDAQPDAVFLDSIVPVGASLERVDHAADRAATELLTACSQIESCASLFDQSPPAAARQAIELYETEEGCAQDAGVTASAVQLQARRLLDGPPDSWIKLIALYEHVVRCSDDDAETVARLLSLRDDEEPPAPPSSSSVHYNPLLNRHLLYRELYRFDETDEERSEFERSALAKGPQRDAIHEEALAFGSDYRAVEAPERASSSVPTILLSGRLDPLDRPEWAVDFAATLGKGTLVSLPWAGHSTLRYLGWGDDACGREVFVAFLHGDIRPSPCLAAHPAPDLGRTEQSTREMIRDWLAKR